MEPTMKNRMVVILALAGALAAVPPLAPGADANTPAAASKAAHAAQYTDAQLDQMLAPIALYPDQLLTQILMAATYPLEVVEADRWVRQPDNAALTGDALNDALKSQPWEPSVKSLAPFPQILHMMDENLTWTEQLGDAFLSDQARTMDAVQRLRKQAQAAGHLNSTQYETVQTQGSQIVIVPAAPDVVYVPVYDPVYVYGPWPYPAYPPFYFGIYFDVAIVGGFGWFGFPIVAPLWGWCDWNWGGRYVFVNRTRYNYLNVGGPPLDNDRWRYDPYHRHGVPYPNAELRERFRSPGGTGEMNRRFRGYPMAQPPMTPGAGGRPGFGAPGTFGGEAGRGEAGRGGPGRGGAGRGGAGQGSVERRNEFERQRQQAERFRGNEAPRFQAPRERAMPPAFESFGRSPGEIRMQSQRGYNSRHSLPMQGGFRNEGGFGGGQGGFGRFRGEGRR
jgi:Protein of unknown function (DUF3300)